MKINVTKEEAQLLAVYRGIAEVDKQHLLGVDQVGDVLNALRSVIDLDKVEKDLTLAEMKQLIYGFVAGIASVVQAEVGAIQPEYNYVEEGEGDYIVAGGPTGGVLAGQGEDPRYIHQTGPRPDEDEVE